MTLLVQKGIIFSVRAQLYWQVKRDFFDGRYNIIHHMTIINVSCDCLPTHPFRLPCTPDIAIQICGYVGQGMKILIC